MNWKATSDFEVLTGPIHLHDTVMTRVEQLDGLVDDIARWLEADTQPGEIAIALPKADPISLHGLRYRLNQRGIPFQILTGTQRPMDSPKCRAFIYLLQLANPHWHYLLSPVEWRCLLANGLGLTYLGAELLDRLIQGCFLYGQQGQELTLQAFLEQYHPGTLADLPEQARAAVTLLSDWLVKVRDMPFHRLVYLAFSNIISRYASERDGFADVKRLMESYIRQWTIQKRHHKQKDDSEQQQAFARMWLSRVKTGVIADTPDAPAEIDASAVLIATPQKLIDAEIKRPVQCWLDASSREWCRSDDAPLYNAWVHSAVWDGSTAAFTEAFKESVIRTRAAHITRTLMLLASRSVHIYSSTLDDEGQEQQGLLLPRLVVKPVSVKPSGTLERATLRPDQQPILNYRKGTMAITAVPGAGKTFVNVELILELIEQGIAPDAILVLTYMDSAAKTLLSRLKAKLHGLGASLPTISTIHSLAYRILSENDHCLNLGYRLEDRVILDDYEQQRLLEAVSAETYVEGSPFNPNTWLRAIRTGVTTCKNLSITLEQLQAHVADNPQSFGIRRFVNAYAAYQFRMNQGGFMDFTDLIQDAVRLLDEFEEIRTYYQARFQVIIEDEAQDSSSLLQRFIGLLGGESPNLIRTGDTNQSITTTFSSADPSVFREFIQQADTTVQMTCSGRCASEIIELANTWMRLASQYPGLEEAFQPAVMELVAGYNPDLIVPITARHYDTEEEEVAWLIDSILVYRKAYPTASMAILLRANDDVIGTTARLHQAGIPAVSHSDQLGQSGAFPVVLAYLQVLEVPGDVNRWLVLEQARIACNLWADSPIRSLFLKDKPLLSRSVTEIQDENLLQLYYDMLDFSRDASGSNVPALIVRMTERLFDSVVDRSNGYLCALQAQQWLSKERDTDDCSPLEHVVRYFAQLKRSRSRPAFTDALSSPDNGIVQLMSLHKAKGQEFDLVFMPKLTSRSFPHQVSQLRIDECDRLEQQLTALVTGEANAEAYHANKQRLKIEEEARLIYVGLTRAKKGLFLSAHRSRLNRYNKREVMEPALVFQELYPVIYPPRQEPAEPGTIERIEPVA
jgi:DNA helicase-2/ATP-dependent DNA helicase PcrA